MIHREHNRSWKAKHLLAQTTVVEVVAVVVVVDAVCASFVATTVILEIVSRRCLRVTSSRTIGADIWIALGAFMSDKHHASVCDWCECQM